MPIITRRHLLAGSAATLAMPALARAQGAKPRLTAISQWSAGSDGAAISALGKLFEEKGGVWQHNPVPGFTTEMMNKLRAQIMAGDPPAVSQLKGPEIAAWSKIAPTVDSPRGCRRPATKTVRRRNSPRAASRRHMDRAAAAGLPDQHAVHVDQGHASASASPRRRPPGRSSTHTAEKMKAAGITPVANGGIRWDDGMKFEIALAGISPDVYRRAIMKLDRKR